MFSFNLKGVPVHHSAEYLGKGTIGGSGLGIVTTGKTHKVAASKPVYLFDAVDMKLLKVRWSNDDGNYLFRCLNESKQYCVLVRDDLKQYPHPHGWDNVTPDTTLTVAEQGVLAKQFYENSKCYKH